MTDQKKVHDRVAKKHVQTKIALQKLKKDSAARGVPVFTSVRRAA